MSQALRRAVWDMHVGPGVQQTHCGLCGINAMSRTQNNGFDTAHIVARKWMVSDEKINVLYLVPSCKSCNSQCENTCVLDFLWCNNRLATLRRIIMVIFNAFVTQHIHELSDEDRMAWRVLEHLFGPSRYPAGGGIINTKAIYEIARIEQQAALIEEAAQLTRELQSISTQLKLLTEAKIQPMKFTGF